MLERMDTWAHGVARLAAMAGGLTLIALVLMTVVSVVMRNLPGVGPIPGDFELVEAGVAFAIIAFMPWCQLTRGHATVEILSSRFGGLFNRLMDVLVDFALLFAWIFLTYRHLLGMLDKKGYGETTFILQFPTWWGYAAALAAMGVTVVVACYCVLRSSYALASGSSAQLERGA